METTRHPRRAANFIILIILVSACAPLKQTKPLSNAESFEPQTVTITPTLVPIQPEITFRFQASSTENSHLAANTVTPTNNPIISISQTSTPENIIRFAVIGDYGEAGIGEKEVSDLVHSWNPDFILTVGDNNYPDGAASTIDANIGQYYHDYIYPYKGNFGSGALTNKFFPSLGNHDWLTLGANPYIDFFALPGNERYYSFEFGSVSFFVVDSDYRNPDGIVASSRQATWLKNSLADSTSPWKIVYFHLPPYSSGIEHGSTPELQWPFQVWGATTVLSGHDHLYERLIINGFPYFNDGLGGNGKYGFNSSPVPGSQVRYNSDYGALLVTASASAISFQFINVQNQVIDTYDISK